MTDYNKTLNVMSKDVLHLDNAELINARVNSFIEARNNTWNAIILINLTSRDAGEINDYISSK